MSESKRSIIGQVRGLLWLVVLAAIGYAIINNITIFGNVLRVLLGFGAVVLVHEFGHFVVGKLSGIKVEAFSIFMPPTVLGVKRTETGLRFRILPELFPKEGDESSEGLLSFTIGRKGRAGETEYRVGLIPFGGFVKFLGQDDIGPVKSCDDPRSFANKSALARAGVITAGVVFNALSAIIIFMVVFLVGIELPPPVVGGVEPGSPAAKAGLKGGDEVIEIAGKSKGLDFSDIGMAAALSGDNEAVAIKVRHEDGTLEEFAIVPEEEQTASGKLRLLGVVQPQTLTVANVSDPNGLRKATGFLPGDRVKAVNKVEVRTHWEMLQAVSPVLEPSVTLSAERSEGPQKAAAVKSDIRLDWMVADSYEAESESQLYHIYSMVPRLRIAGSMSPQDISAATSLPAKVWSRLAALFIKADAAQTGAGKKPVLEAGDIILKIGDVNNPTYAELRRLTKEYENAKLPVTVLRTDANGVEKTVTLDVEPRHNALHDRVLIGIAVALDANHAVVAKTIGAEGGPPRLDIPPGSVITAVDGVAVSSFYDVVRQIKKYPGQRITLDYRLNEQVAGSVGLDMTVGGKLITVQSDLAQLIPFDILTRVYKANGPVEAVVTGCRKTIGFITQTYVTLKRLVGGLIGPKSLIGPVGILTLSYRIVTEQPLVYYVYFLGLISAVIAVFNFLPLPPLDGGLVALLLIEKIKGSALSERAQGIVIYAGWALIGTLILYITFNDVVRSFFS